MRMRTSVFAACFAVTACAGDAIVSVPREETPTQFWAMKLDIGAATVAIDETQRLVASPLDASGNTMTNIPRPRFYSTDEARVTVDSNGVVTGHMETGSTYVIATLTVDGVTHADTASIAVTPTRHSIGSVDITGAWGMALPTTVEMVGFASIAVSVTDSDGFEIPGLAVDIYSVDPKIASASIWGIQGVGIGKTKVVATTTSYGQTVADTIEIGVIYPTSASLYMSASDGHVSRVVGAGSFVTWYNFISPQQAVTLVFDDTGETLQIGVSGSVSKQFTTPGTYKYKNVTRGTTGAIIVYAQPVY